MITVPNYERLTPGSMSLVYRAFSSMGPNVKVVSLHALQYVDDVTNRCPWGTMAVVSSP